jgi:thioredoxin 1
MLKSFYSLLCACFVIASPISALETSEAPCVIQLKDAQFEDFIRTADKPVIIDFWAEWCGPCMKMKPIFEELADEFKGQYHFVSVNVDEGKQIASKYDVKTIPTFKIIKDGNVIKTFVGQTSKEIFIENIDNAINKTITQNTLLSAIQANDQELVKLCLAHKAVDVNMVTQTSIMNITTPMTPLMMAVSQAMFGRSSIEIISMLLQAGAQIDLEIDSPLLDESMNVIGSNKVSAQLFVKEAAGMDLEEKLAAIQDEAVRQHLINFKKNASNILELFKTSATSNIPQEAN